MRGLMALGCIMAGIAALACGDNQLADSGALPSVDNVVIVAHPDDDLLFMQPDLWRDLDSGQSLVTVYVTAGQAKKSVQYAESRQRAVLNGYALASGASTWNCGSVLISDRTAERCSAVGSKGDITLLFLGLPDGGPVGDFPGSLLSLWQNGSTAKTVARTTQPYNQQDLVRVLASILQQTQPKQVMTLDVMAIHGEDHSDHLLVGAATIAAVAQARTAAPVIAFRGYNIANEPINKNDEMYNAVSVMMRGYESCATGCGQCGRQPCEQLSPYYEGLLRRRYATSFTAQQRRGRLQTFDQCLQSDLSLGACEAAPRWTFADDRIKLGDSCLMASNESQSLLLVPCASSTNQWWRLGDDGNIVSGVLAPALTDMLLVHTSCIGAVNGRAQRQTCGGSVAPRWNVLRQWQATDLSPTSIATALGDIDDDKRAELCELQSDGIFCRRSLENGMFSSSTRVDQDRSDLWQGESLVVASDSAGARGCVVAERTLRCAALVTKSSAAWRNVFEVAVDPATLSMIDVNRDGLLDVCVATAENESRWQCFDAAGQLTLSMRRVPGTVLIDVDGDGAVDSCGPVSGQWQCILTGLVPWQGMAVPWSYAQGGLSTLSTTGRVAWRQSTPTRYVEVCIGDSSQLQCAQGNRNGLGPAETIAMVPDGGISGPLMLADLNGDGNSEICYAQSGQLLCTH
jgi:LmbE family N-acetylglucosaminyl deacetylase